MRCKYRVMDSCNLTQRPCNLEGEKCINYAPEEAPKQTNADLIRSMTDAELAEFIAKIRGDIIRTQLKVSARRDDEVAINLKWLQSESEVGK